MEHTNELHTAESRILPFDPIVLVQDVARRWLLILLAALAVGVGAYIYTDATYQPVYRTRTTFVVTARGSASTVYSNLTSTTNLATVFTDLLNSSLLRKTIVRELGVQSFDGTIAASEIPETNLLTVTVTASDPRTAFLVSQAIIDHHEEVTYQVVDGICLEVLQQPAVPLMPATSSDAMGQMKKMAMITAAAMVLLLGFLSFTRKTVRSGSEANSRLNCSFLGEIPHENKHKTFLSRFSRRKTSILITNPTTSFRFVETIRKLRRRTERMMHGRKMLMVTSLLENEGKSTVAVNLALALAQKHSRVLLVDCDLRKPACHALLEHGEVAFGLRDVLSGRATLAEAVAQEKKSSLNLLLETRGSQNSGDLIASEQMKALLQQLRRDYDYVILDLPPMSEVSDAESVMEYADASLLVVRQNTAAASAVNKAIDALDGGKAIDALDGGKAKLLGCVLNNVHSTRIFSGEGHGYGYGYGHRYGKYGKYGHYGHYGYYQSGKSK